MNKLEAIRNLSTHDHAFLKESYIKKLGKIFGLKIPIRQAYSDPPGTFKGLSLYDDKGNPIETARGQDADIIACDIAQQLNIDYTSMFGRGSALRECCRAIEEHLLSHPE